jgi:hypothetical protein
VQPRILGFGKARILGFTKARILGFTKARILGFTKARILGFTKARILGFHLTEILILLNIKVTFFDVTINSIPKLITDSKTSCKLKFIMKRH